MRFSRLILACLLLGPAGAAAQVIPGDTTRVVPPPGTAAVSSRPDSLSRLRLAVPEFGALAQAMLGIGARPRGGPRREPSVASAWRQLRPADDSLRLGASRPLSAYGRMAARDPLVRRTAPEADVAAAAVVRDSLGQPIPVPAGTSAERAALAVGESPLAWGTPGWTEALAAARADELGSRMRSRMWTLWDDQTRSGFVSNAPAPPPTEAQLDAAVRPGTGTPAPAADVSSQTPRRAAADSANALTDILGSLPGTDLGLQLQARVESKLERSRNERCLASQILQLGSNCAGAFQPSFDFQFNVRTGGVVAERVHVNVDYDSQREFDASNNISVFYQGKSDELINRLEVGNVSFAPPSSRFITAGIPSGNYGLQAIGQIGPMRFRTIAAQQKGNVVKNNVFTVGDRTLQTVDRDVFDYQVEPRRFFFTVDPRLFAGYPNIDILNRTTLQQLAGALPDTLRPVRVFVYRQLIGAANQNPQGPRLVVRGLPREQVRQPYELQRENVDYYLDPSQLWISLVRPLNVNSERLAVAYEVNVNGVRTRYVATGGTPDQQFTEATQYANLLFAPEVQPTDSAVFLREIRNVYRVGGDDVRRETVGLRVVTGSGGDQEKPVDPSRGDTYLQMFGLAQANNSATFDVENRLWPRPQDPNYNPTGGTNAKLIRDYFLVYPSLQPFARAGLAGSLAGGQQANPANDTIYSFPSEYLYSSQRPQAVYRMRLRYQAEGGADAGSLPLGSVQVRPNSERISVNGRQLTRGSDYNVDYDLGAVTFTRPDTLFPSPTQVTVSFEENPLFATQPTNIFGIASQFPMTNGELNFTAISQTQRTTFNRPPLGFEPASSLVAGVQGNFQWDASALTRGLERIPGVGSTGPSRIALQGEIATSRPQPNSAGQAYVESFEGEGGVTVALSETAWYYSSRPPLGATRQDGQPLPLTLDRASTMAWQNLGAQTDGRPLTFTIQQIDPAVRFQGGGVQSPEQLLWMTLYPLSTGGLLEIDETGAQDFKWKVGGTSELGTTPTGRRWRSIRTSLGASGADLSRIENLEFYALVNIEESKRGLNPTLVFDFGEVSENSVTFAPETLTIQRTAAGVVDSTWRGKQLQGLDRLDSERDPLSRGFNAAVNDVGLAGDVIDSLVIDDRTGGAPIVRADTNVRICSAQVGATLQVLGDSRSNCTVRNSRQDDEDLDLDGELNIRDPDLERIKRFVVDLGDPASYTRLGVQYVEVSGSGPTARVDTLRWVQVRIPFRAPQDSIGSPNDRRVRALRVTMVSGPDLQQESFNRTALARLRLVGSPWLKRSDRVLSGIGGDSTAGQASYVIASVIGTQDSTEQLDYQPPPGVVEGTDAKQTGFENSLVQVNERSLRLQAGVNGGELGLYQRAEAFYRFPEGLKNFMGYRTMRLWARGRGNGWGQNGELEFFVKLGRDENNFYMYRTGANAGQGQATWLPEVRVEFARFQALRAELQTAFLQGDESSRFACSDVDLELIRRSGVPRGQVVNRFAACQDGYMVYTADPNVTPPNMAAVQELAVGMVRVDSGGTSMNRVTGDTLELWVDDIRLTDVVDTPGFAGELALSVHAGDLADFRVSVNRRDPNFRQLAEQASFITANAIDIGSTFHLERFLPQALGYALPLRVNYSGSGSSPVFINNSDVRGDAIPGLRTPSDGATSYELAIRRVTPMQNSLLAPLLNNLALVTTYRTAHAQSAFQNAEQSNFALRADYDLAAGARTRRLPGWAGRAVSALPSWLENTEAARALRGAQFRWTPTQFRLSSLLTRNTNRQLSFLKPAEAADDSGRVVRGLDHVWRNEGAIAFQPLSGLSARLNVSSLLDQRDYRDALGLRDTSLVDRPDDRAIVATGERTRFAGLDLGLERERQMGIGLRIAPPMTVWFRPYVDVNTSYQMMRDPNARSLLRLGDSTGAFRLPRRLGNSQNFQAGTTLDLGRAITLHVRDSSRLGRVARAFQPVDVTFSRTLSSNFDNTPFSPGLGYQFGLGGLDAFRQVDGQLATSAGNTARLSITNTLTLPFQLSLASRFERASTQNFTRRSLSNTHAVSEGEQLTYPDLSLRWNWRPPAWAAKIVSSVGANARLLQQTQATRAPTEEGGTADERTTKTNSYPVNASISWAFAGGFSTSAGYNVVRRRDEQPGAASEGTTRELNVDVARTFPAPASWKLRGGLRTRASYQQSNSESLIFSGGTPIAGDTLGALTELRRTVQSDQGRRTFNFNADTELAETLSLSITGSHLLSFNRNFGQRFSQTVFSAVLQWQFYSGELR